MSSDDTGGHLCGEIMVVEDNVSDLKFLSDILMKAGYNVRPASDGGLALRSVRAKLPDLILLDINMPDMNGVEVCRCLKDDIATKDIPVIFISAERDSELKVKALEAGGVDYVTKPIEPAEVVARINTHFNIHRMQRSLAGQSEELIAEIEERKRAAEELNRRTHELSALNALGQQVNASLTLAQVTQVSLDSIVAPIAPDLALIFLREDDKLVLQGADFPNATLHHDATPVHRVGECLCGLAAMTRKAVYSLNVHCDPRCTWKECKKAGVRSFAALPLTRGEEIIGVLGVASGTERDFGKQASFLEALANEIAMALHNAILYERVKRNASELEMHVGERTAELRKTVNLMAGRENRMAELKRTIKKLCTQLEEAGMTPVMGEPLMKE